MARQTRSRGRPWTVALLCLALPALPHGVRLRARDRLLALQAVLGRGLGEPGLPAADREARAESNRVSALEAQVEQLRRLLREAGAAREVVERGNGARTIPAMAHPLARGADLLQRLVLDRGRADGVEEGQAVLAGDALVGRVARVLETRCEVLLVTDPQFQVRATLTRPEGEVEGLLRGDGSPLLLFVPALQDPSAPAPEARPGDAVHTSRQSLLCAVPVVCGTVEEVVRLPGVPIPVARVLPAMDPLRLERVVVLQSGVALQAGGS